VLNPDSPLGALLRAPMRPGVVVWIGIRPARREPLVAVPSATVDPVGGLLGDHYRNATSRRRQVTLMQSEHVSTIGHYLGVSAVAPALLRRNIVVAGINLLALKERHVRVGAALLEITGECHPCSRMEEILGAGGYNAVRGHGGVTARVIAGGTIRVGDGVARVEPD
jgi:MOSC domain-containing protein YiiM